MEYPLTREEMLAIRKLIAAMQDEIHHPGAWQENDGLDPAEMDAEIDDACRRLDHAISNGVEG